MNIDTLRDIFPSGYIGIEGKTFAVDSAHNSTTLATTTDYFNWTLTSAGTTLAATNETDRITAEGVTPGTAAAGEALVLGPSGEIATITSATILTLTSTAVNTATQSTTGVTTTTSGVGAKNGATVTVVEQGNSVMHKTILTLASTPITLTDDAGNGAYAALKIYDCPEGDICVLGATMDIAGTLTETWWVDTKEGDVGLGSVATAVGTALTSTTQDIIPSTAMPAMIAQVPVLKAQSVAAIGIGTAAGTDADFTINFRIDDDVAHFPDAVTNGAMAADTDWTKGTGWTVHTVTAGKADCDGTQTAVSDLSQDISAVEGVSYSVAFTLSSFSAGTVTPYLGGTVGTARSTDATHTETIVAGADGILLFRASDDFVGKIDDAIATPLTGSGTLTGTVTVVWANAGDIA